MWDEIGDSVDCSDGRQQVERGGFSVWTPGCQISILLLFIYNCIKQLKHLSKKVCIQKFNL